MPRVSARMMKSTANLVRRSCITLHCRQQTIFMLEADVTYHESDTRNPFFRPISEEIARLLIVCFLMMT